MNTCVGSSNFFMQLFLQKFYSNTRQNDGLKHFFRILWKQTRATEYLENSKIANSFFLLRTIYISFLNVSCCIVILVSLSCSSFILAIFGAQEHLEFNFQTSTGVFTFSLVRDHPSVMEKSWIIVILLELNPNSSTASASISQPLYSMPPNYFAGQSPPPRSALSNMAEPVRLVKPVWWWPAWQHQHRLHQFLVQLALAGIGKFWFIIYYYSMQCAAYFATRIGCPSWVDSGWCA